MLMICNQLIKKYVNATEWCTVLLQIINTVIKEGTKEALHVAERQHVDRKSRELESVSHASILLHNGFLYSFHFTYRPGQSFLCESVNKLLMLV